MEFSDRTIILRVGGFREADLWVRLLSASRGVFSAFAFGGSHSRRRFSGCLDLFNEVLFQVKSSARGPYMILQEGLLLNGPKRLRTDWKRMGMAVNCSLFIEAFCSAFPEPAGSTASRGRNESDKLTSAVQNEPAIPSGMHRLFSELLQLLETAPEVPALLPVFFRARLACDQGYGIQTARCACCGVSLDTLDTATLYSSGELLCASCAAPASGCSPMASAPQGRAFLLNAGSLRVLRGILTESPADWEDGSHWHSGYQEPGTRLNALEQRGLNRAMADCARALDAFLQFNTGLAWANGYFKRL